MRAEQDEMPVDVRGDTASCVLLKGVYIRVVGRLAAAREGAEDGASNRVGGVALRVCRVEKDILLLEPLRGDDARDVEAALCERARLVKDDGVRVGKCLEVVAALDEDARAARAADTRKEGEGDGDDEGAASRDDEEGERAVDPHGEGIARDGRRDDGEQQGADDDGGRVPAGKARDERLSRCLLVRRLLHE